jgi:hypothetical protein
MDYIKRLRQNQHELTRTLDSSLQAQFRKRAADNLIRAAKRRKEETNPNVAFHLAGMDVRESAHKAVLGYGDWLGCKLWRQNMVQALPPAVTLPECTPEDRAAIAKKHGVKKSILNGVIDKLTSSENVSLWPVGRISKGTALIHAKGLAKWASHYDWSPQPEKEEKSKVRNKAPKLTLA